MHLPPPEDHPPSCPEPATASPKHTLEADVSAHVQRLSASRAGSRAQGAVGGGRSFVVRLIKSWCPWIT